jgi:hypothetical protein
MHMHALVCVYLMFSTSIIRPLLSVSVRKTLFNSDLHNEKVDRGTLNKVVATCKPADLIQPIHKAIARFSLNTSTTQLKKPQPELYTQKACEEIARVYYVWASEGFPSTSDKIVCLDFRTAQHIQGILLEWLMPQTQACARQHHAIWSLSDSLSHVLGLHELVCKNAHRHQLRVLLRAFGHKVQRIILTHDFDQKVWHTYVRQCYRSVWHPDKVPQQALLYFMFASQQKEWYVGKCNITRQTTKQDKSSGEVARYREHIQNTWKANNVYGHETRYRKWRQAMPWEIHRVPAVWHTEKNICVYERHVINAFQAPIQNRVVHGSMKPAKARAWPKHRTKLNIQQELNLNVCKELTHPRNKYWTETDGVTPEDGAFRKLCLKLRF